MGFVLDNQFTGAGTKLILSGLSRSFSIMPLSWSAVEYSPLQSSHKFMRAFPLNLEIYL